MALLFQKYLKEARFLDPNQGYSEACQVTEIRVDPLTGRTGRILHFPLRVPEKPDLAALVAASLEMGCPFCPEAVDTATPRFAPDVVPEGQVRVGEALVFPNLFPYDTHSAVGLFSGQHFVPLTGFSQKLLADGFLASQGFLRHALGSQGGYSSINWNYMPLSGGSIIHPHLQIIAGDLPTTYQREALAQSRSYREAHGSLYWADLLEAEQAAGERYIGAIGGVPWLASFVPKGFMDFLALFPGKLTIADLTARDLADFAEGLLRIFNYLDHKDLWSFNLALYSGLPGEGSFWVHARLVPRYTVSSLGISDIRYTEVLHDEVLTTLKPEEVCREVRRYVRMSGMMPSEVDPVGKREPTASHRHPPAGRRATPSSSREGSVIAAQLTSPEENVLKLMVEGLTNRQIAARLSLAEATVKKHVQTVIAKLQASDRTQAAVKAVRAGMVPELPNGAGQDLASRTQSADIPIQGLEASYLLRKDRVEITRYLLPRGKERTRIVSILRSSHHAVAVLREAASVLESLFGRDVKLYLDVDRDPESGFEEVFATVRSLHAPEVGLQLMTEFDQKWWLDRLPYVEGRLNFVWEPLG